nr:MAG TPA: hypothetical protein [Caudoviricetes sp.]
MNLSSQVCTRHFTLCHVFATFNFFISILIL